MATIIGIIIGFVFGFLLQKGNVANFNTIIKQLLLKDFTVAKTMLTAIVVGGILTYTSIEAGLITKPLVSLAPALNVIIGSLIFGVGMAILGYCPGTCIAAAGSGSRDALFGVVGMFIGAICFQYIPFLITLKNYMQTPTLFVNHVFGLHPITFLCVLLSGTLLLFYILEKNNL